MSTHPHGWFSRLYPRRSAPEVRPVYAPDQTIDPYEQSDRRAFRLGLIGFYTYLAYVTAIVLSAIHQVYEWKIDGHSGIRIEIAGALWSRTTLVAFVVVRILIALTIFILERPSRND